MCSPIIKKKKKKKYSELIFKFFSIIMCPENMELLDVEQRETSCLWVV